MSDFLQKYEGNQFFLCISFTRVERGDSKYLLLLKAQISQSLILTRHFTEGIIIQFRRRFNYILPNLLLKYHFSILYFLKNTFTYFSELLEFRFGTPGIFYISYISVVKI